MVDKRAEVTLSLRDRITQPTRRVTQQFERLRRTTTAIGKSSGFERLRMQTGSVRSSAGRMSASLGALAGSTARLGGALGVLGGAGVWAFKSQFVDTASKFEMLQKQLGALTGSSENAEKAMDWIFDFAANTPAQIDDITSTFARLKAFGLDPMDGTLQAIVDQTSKLGYSQDRMMGISTALGQAWVKQKLQGEEILQLIERGVPVWDLLAKVTGKNTKQLQELSSAGELGRDVMSKLIEQIGKESEGAAESMMDTWAGMTSNLMDRWTQIKLKIMQGGLFDFLKARLSELLDRINKLAESGKLEEKLERVSAWMIDVAKRAWAMRGEIWGAIKGAVEAVQTLVSAIRTVVDAVGGWKNALIILGTVMSARAIASTALFAKEIYTLVRMIWTRAIPALSAYGGAARLAGKSAKTAGGGINWLGGSAGKSVKKVGRLRRVFGLLRKGLTVGGMFVLKKFWPVALGIALGEAAHRAGLFQDEMASLLKKLDKWRGKRDASKQKAGNVLTQEEIKEAERGTSQQEREASMQKFKQAQLTQTQLRKKTYERLGVDAARFNLMSLDEQMAAVRKTKSKLEIEVKASPGTEGRVKSTDSGDMDVDVKNGVAMEGAM